MFHGRAVSRFRRVERVARRRPLQIHAAAELASLRIAPGNPLAALKADREGRHSDRINEEIHPGEILLQDFMKPMGIRARQLAADIDLSPSRISELVNDRRPITADTALDGAPLRDNMTIVPVRLREAFEARALVPVPAQGAGGGLRTPWTTWPRSSSCWPWPWRS